MHGNVHVCKVQSPLHRKGLCSLQRIVFLFSEASPFYFWTKSHINFAWTIARESQETVTDGAVPGGRLWQIVIRDVTQIVIHALTDSAHDSALRAKLASSLLQ